MLLSQLSGLTHLSQLSPLDTTGHCLLLKHLFPQPPAAPSPVSLAPALAAPSFAESPHLSDPLTLGQPRAQALGLFPSSLCVTPPPP